MLAGERDGLERVREHLLLEAGGVGPYTAALAEDFGARPSPGVGIELAAVLRRVGRLDAAEAVLRQAWALDGADPWVVWELLSLLQAQGEPPRALRAFVAEALPALAGHALDAALLAEVVARPAGVERFARQAQIVAELQHRAMHEEGCGARQRLARRLSHGGAVAEALAWLAVPACRRSDLRVETLRVSLMWRQGWRRAGLTRLRELARLYPSVGEVVDGLRELEGRSGRTLAAAEAAAALVSLRRERVERLADDPLGWRELAMASLVAGDGAGALRAAEQVWLLRRDAAAKVLLARVYQVVGDRSASEQAALEAAALLQAWAEAAPERYGRLLARGWVLFDWLGAYGAAWSLAQEVMVLDESWAEGWYLACVSQEGVGDWGSAQGSCAGAVQRAPQWTAPRLRLVALWQAVDQEKWRASAREVLVLAPEQRLVRRGLADGLAQAGDWEESVAVRLGLLRSRGLSGVAVGDALERLAELGMPLLAGWLRWSWLGLDLGEEVGHWRAVAAYLRGVGAWERGRGAARRLVAWLGDGDGLVEHAVAARAQGQRVEAVGALRELVGQAAVLTVDTRRVRSVAQHYGLMDIVLWSLCREEGKGTACAAFLRR